MGKELNDKERKKLSEKFETFNSKDYSEEDIEKVLKKENKLKSLFSKKQLKEYADFFHDLMDMIKDYFNGNYKEIPWTAIATAIGTMIYVFSPADLIPDVFPAIGLIDDAFIVGLCLTAISVDVKKYKKWKATQEELNEEFKED